MSLSVPFISTVALDAPRLPPSLILCHYSQNALCIFFDLVTRAEALDLDSTYPLLRVVEFISGVFLEAIQVGFWLRSKFRVTYLSPVSHVLKWCSRQGSQARKGKEPTLPLCKNEERIIIRHCFTFAFVHRK